MDPSGRNEDTARVRALADLRSGLDGVATLARYAVSWSGLPSHEATHNSQRTLGMAPGSRPSCERWWRRPRGSRLLLVLLLLDQESLSVERSALVLAIPPWVLLAESASAHTTPALLHPSSPGSQDGSRGFRNSLHPQQLPQEQATTGPGFRPMRVSDPGKMAGTMDVGDPP